MGISMPEIDHHLAVRASAIAMTIGKEQGGRKPKEGEMNWQ